MHLKKAGLSFALFCSSLFCFAQFCSVLLCTAVALHRAHSTTLSFSCQSCAVVAVSVFINEEGLAICVTCIQWYRCDQMHAPVEEVVPGSIYWCVHYNSGTAGDWDAQTDRQTACETLRGQEITECPLTLPHTDWVEAVLSGYQYWLNGGGTRVCASHALVGCWEELNQLPASGFCGGESAGTKRGDPGDFFGLNHTWIATRTLILFSSDVPYVIQVIHWSAKRIRQYLLTCKLSRYWYSGQTNQSDLYRREMLAQCWFDMGQRRRLWANIDPTLDQRLFFAACGEWGI